jgi:DNA polymerase III subunit beta
MKVICNRSALVEAVLVTSSVVPSRSPKPVLSNLKLLAAGDKLVICATDQEIAVKCVDAQVQIDVPGETLVPADKLRDIVRESVDDTLSLSVEGNEMHVRGADSQFKIFTQSASEFPPIPEHEGEHDVQITAAELKGLISKTLFATAKEGTRYAFNGVLFTLDKQQLAMIATDGRRLAMARADLVDIVPARSLSIVDKLLTNPDEIVSIKLTENQAVFSTPDSQLTTNLLEGQFPAYEEVIPKEADKRMTAGTADFLSAVRRAALLTSDDSKGVRMEFTKAKGLVLTSRNPESGEARVDFTCKFDGVDIAIGFNPTFLVDALKVVDSDEVAFEMTTPNRPGLVKGGANFVYVIMPVNL